MAEKNEKAPRSHAEAKRAYEALAAQVTAMAARRPKVRVEIEERVKKELGDFDRQFDELKSRKAEAAREMYAAEERERPAREAKAAAEAEARVRAGQKAKADENAARQAEAAKALNRRLADAAK